MLVKFSSRDLPEDELRLDVTLRRELRLAWIALHMTTETRR